MKKKHFQNIIENYNENDFIKNVYHNKKNK